MHSINSQPNFWPAHAGKYSESKCLHDSDQSANIQNSLSFFNPLSPPPHDLVHSSACEHACLLVFCVCFVRVRVRVRHICFRMSLSCLNAILITIQDICFPLHNSVNQWREAHELQCWGAQPFESKKKPYRGKGKQEWMPFQSAMTSREQRQSRGARARKRVQTSEGCHEIYSSSGGIKLRVEIKTPVPFVLESLQQTLLYFARLCKSAAKYSHHAFVGSNLTPTTSLFTHERINLRFLGADTTSRSLCFDEI